RARRAAAAAAALVISSLAMSGARADDHIGLVLSASTAGTPTTALEMRIPAEASAGTIAVFVRQTTNSTLYGVKMSATPLVDESGVTSVAPTFDPDLRTLPPGDVLRRGDLAVSGLNALGTFRSTLYATHGTLTQTLGVLT